MGATRIDHRVGGVSPLEIPSALRGARIRAILARVSVLSPFEGAEPVLDPLDHFRQAGGNRSVSCSLMGRSCVERSLRQGSGLSRK